MMSRRSWFLLALSAAFVFRCQFSADPSSGKKPSETRLIGVEIYIEGPTVNNSYCLITVSTADSQINIGPTKFPDRGKISAAVPSGMEWKFRCERFIGNSVLIDTGSTKAEVFEGMDPVVIRLTAAIDPPRITRQPVDCRVAVGGQAVFSISATGEVFSFQWLKGNEVVKDETDDSLFIEHVSFSDSGSTWRCIVTNIAGSDTSTGATLTVVREKGTSIYTADAKDDEVAPLIIIKDTVIWLIAGDKYIDSGVTAYDIVDGDVTSRIIKEGTVNTDKAGVYTITYTVSGRNGVTSKAIRRIIVVDSLGDAISRPIILLKGSDTVNLNEGIDFEAFIRTWKDPGYLAFDKRDGDITDSVKVSTAVKADSLSWYIVYSAADSDGNFSLPVKRYFVISPRASVLRNRPVFIALRKARG